MIDILKWNILTEMDLHHFNWLIEGIVLNNVWCRSLVHHIIRVHRVSLEIILNNRIGVPP